MKLRLFALTTTAVMIAGTGFARAVDPARLLVPGKQVGGIRIGADMDATVKRLGKPDTGDGAMGRFTTTYFAKSAPHYRLDVYSHRVFLKNDKDKVIVQTVRLESPYFRTVNGIHSTSDWSAIKARYPKLKPVARWEPIPSSDPRRVTLYDDKGQGIGFEMRDGDQNATALYIHAPGSAPQPLAHDNLNVWKQVDL